LAAELESVELAISQGAPKFALNIGLGAAKVSSEARALSLNHKSPLTRSADALSTSPHWGEEDLV
jgi:hypothetical protein